LAEPIDEHLPAVPAGTAQEIIKRAAYLDIRKINVPLLMNRCRLVKNRDAAVPPFLPCVLKRSKRRGAKTKVFESNDFLQKSHVVFPSGDFAVLRDGGAFNESHYYDTTIPVNCQ
jgi:hypothetical protein